MNSKSSSIYDSFSPLYFALKLFGMLNFRMSPRSGKVTVKFYNVLWMMFWWMLLTVLIFFNMTQGAREPNESSELILTGWHWLLIMHLFSVFFIQLWSLVRRREIEKMFRIMSDFDDFVSERCLHNFKAVKFIIFCCRTSHFSTSWTFKKLKATRGI
jgi:hypothetical protein